MKIALITPYSGSNLGDAAIQEAVIQNIRKRCPFADIRMVTLNPDQTSQLHGLPCFPITSLTVPNYSSGRLLVKSKAGTDDKPSLSGNEEGERGFLSDIKTNIRKFPRLFSVLKRGYELLKKSIHFPSLVFGEVSHIAEAFRVMKDADIFLVSGGGQIDDYWGGHWGHPFSLFKWGLVSKVVGARYVFLAVGTCSLESKLSVFFIRHALGMATYRSYRDETSKNLLKDFSFTHSDPVCPDLAWSFDGKSSRTIPSSDVNSGKTVGVSPIAYLRHNWPKKDRSVYETYLKNLTVFTANLIRKGFSIVFFVSDGPDGHVVKEMLEIFAEDSDLDISGKVCQVRTETLDELLSCLTKVDYVVASRLHGILLAHLMAKPVLAISYDRKVDTYMQDLGFFRYRFDIYDFDVDSLGKAFDGMVNDVPAIEEGLKKIGTEYSSLLNKQYDKLLGI